MNSTHSFHICGSGAISGTDRRPTIKIKDAPIALITQEFLRSYKPRMETKSKYIFLIMSQSQRWSLERENLWLLKGVPLAQQHSNLGGDKIGGIQVNLAQAPAWSPTALQAPGSHTGRKCKNSKRACAHILTLLYLLIVQVAYLLSSLNFSYL